ncbi:hypothetical protein DOM21_05720 [Bacteriovorax stolpii]|uniref:Uncharacterized protein n=2 Tax=Bacteriovorax stolpii TaxID=960 RepID=A0A2K9NVF5_BACTC|nr:hypothetical protein C0V70_13220 [Bacteriovorax stolpii]QDK40961.1 hypothetical protein DOM21_05720 [Bacteriovorax stolpii]TDP55429.1 hypothetical protein C8D79_0478 [Bacteriovorax stolpii]
MDFSLFPNKEEWGSGDEAMDNKLSIALRKAQENLSISSISEFYFYGLSLKPRAYNPSFHVTIEFVTKAFLSLLHPDECNDQLMHKIKGGYFNKKKVAFQLNESESVATELKKKGTFRYKGEIDFYLHRQLPEERNPFVRVPLKRANLDLHTKIIMKDFKLYLNGEKDESLYADPLFRALRVKDQVLFIENFAELWYHEGQIFSLPLFEN